MGVFNRIMLCLAFFLVVDQESVGNTTLSEAYGNNDEEKMENTHHPTPDNRVVPLGWIIKSFVDHSWQVLFLRIETYICEEKLQGI